MAEIVKVKQNDANVIMEFTKNSVFSNYRLEKGIYTVPLEDFELIKRDFIISVRIEERNIDREEEGINCDSLDKLVSEGYDKSFTRVRNNFHYLNGENASNEELFDITLKIAKEILNIKRIPVIKKEIKQLIHIVESNNLSYSLETIKAGLHELENKGGDYEQYLNIKKLLESIIRKTYFKNLSNVVSDEFSGTYLIKEDNDVYLLNKNNAYMFSYGLIYSPTSIKSATNEDESIMVPFNELNKDSYKIELKEEDKPIGVYAVTIGEKDLNENYVKAQALVKRLNLNSFLNVDLTKFMEGEDLEVLKNDFIRRMLISSNRIAPDQEIKKSYYQNLGIFFDRFLELKSKHYEQGNIINLFEKCCRIVYGQCYSDLGFVLRTEKNLEGEDVPSLDLNDIKDILEYSIHYDFNIYKKEAVTNNDIALFVGKFYMYRNNRYLNMIYPGIGNLLDYLGEIKDDNYDVVRDYINEKRRDPWELSQHFRPSHVQAAYSSESTSRGI